MARGHDPISRIVQNLFTIQRMGNSIQAEGQVLLDALFDAIAADIEHIDPTGPSIQRWRRFRANQLIERVEQRLAKVFPEWEAVVQRDLARAGASQGAFAEDTLIFSLGRTAAKGVVRKTPITLARANTILNTHPFGGISGKHVLADWAGGLEAATREAIVEQIRMGMLAEEGIPDLVRRVRGARSGSTVNALGRKVPRYIGGVWKSTTRDATAIVRTAVTSISATAQLETYQKNAEVVQGVQYSATIDSSTTELCMSLDGTIWAVNSPKIIVPGVGTHMQCMTGDTKVLSRFGIAGASKRWFDGEVVFFRTASGRELTCTPNHPILTDAGWEASGVLNKGDHVISDSGNEWEPSIEVDGNSKDVPALIHEIAETFFTFGKMVSEEMETTTPDFHGDGMDGQIAIIGTDSQLRDRLQATFLEHIREQGFPLRNGPPDPFSGLGGKAKFFESLGSSASSFVRSLGELLSFFKRRSVHPGLLLLGSITDMNLVFAEQVIDDPSRDTKLLSYTSRTASRRIHGQNSLLGQYRMPMVNGDHAVLSDDSVDHLMGHTEGIGNGSDCLPPKLARDDGIGVEIGLVPSNHDAPIFEPIGDGFGADAELATQIRSGATGKVFLDQIINVERRQWSGHVFNLETGSGFYSANGIITHNCRSALVPVINYEKFGLTPPKDGFRKARDLSGLSTEDLNKKISTRRSQGLLGRNKNIRSSTTAEQWLKGESQRVQDHMLGPGKAKLFREGKITLKDMVRDDLTTVPLSELLEGLP